MAVTFQHPGVCGKALPVGEGRRTFAPEKTTWRRELLTRRDRILPDTSRDADCAIPAIQGRVVLNATRRTLQSLVGCAFDNPSDADRSPAIAYASDDIGGRDQHLPATQSALPEVPIPACLLVDHPRTESTASVADAIRRSVPLSSSTRPKTSSTHGWKSRALT